MAPTHSWNSISISVTTQQAPATFSPTLEEQWDTEPVSTGSVSSPPEDIISLEQSSSTRGVTSETQFDRQWYNTPTTSLGPDTFQQSSNLTATTPLTRADESFTSQQEFGGSSIFTSSVVTATFSDIINETDAPQTTGSSNSMTAYDEFKLALIVTLSIVIGCFAITAISLRIRSRIKKRRLDAEISKRRRRLREGSSKPPVRRVTIRMGRKQSCNFKINTQPVPLQRSHSPSLQSRAKIPEVHIVNNLDRNRTLDALLDAGTYPLMDQVPLGMRRECTRSERASSKTTLLTKDMVNEAGENAYDNTGMSSIDEMPTESSMLSEETLRMKTDADVHHSNHVAMTQNASDSDDASGEEKSNCVESSETESLSDAKKRIKLNKYFGMRSNQRNDSKDSGYVESFISQDSLRLQAMASLEEGRMLADGHMIPHGQEKLLPRLGTFEPSFFMTSVNEASPSMNLNRSSSVKSEYDERYVHPYKTDRGVLGARRSRYSVPSFPSHNRQYLQRNRPINLSPYHEVFGGPYMSFQTNIMRYPSTDSSMYDCNSTQSDYGPMTRKLSQGHHVLPRSLGFETALYNSLASPHHQVTDQYRALNKRAKRFVKRRSFGTQTVDPDMTAEPNVKSFVQWDYDSTGNLVVKRRENLGLDFIGPVYMAEELTEPINQHSDCAIEIESGVHTSSI